MDESEGLRTHDLIGCPCGGSGKASANSDIRKDSSASSEEKPFYVEDSEASDDGYDDAASLPEIPALIQASKISEADIEEQESRIASGTHPLQAKSKERLEQEMQSLMRYTHLNTIGCPDLEEGSEEVEQMEEIVEDDCLMGVLRGDGETKSGIAYVFKKTISSKVEQVGEEARIKIKEERVVSSFFKQRTNLP